MVLVLVLMCFIQLEIYYNDGFWSSSFQKKKIDRNLKKFIISVWFFNF